MGDFERTYGAGANIEGIIRGYRADEDDAPRKRTFRAFDTKQITFHDYKNALAFAKQYPGSPLIRDTAQETARMSSFSVTPSKGNKYFRFTDDIANQFNCSAIAEKFAFRVPLDVGAWDGCTSMAWESMGGSNATPLSVSGYLAMATGYCSGIAIEREPLELSEIYAILSANDMAFIPKSEDICLIVSNLEEIPSVDAALITEYGATVMLHGRNLDWVYDLIVTPNPR